MTDLGILISQSQLWPNGRLSGVAGKSQGHWLWRWLGLGWTPALILSNHVTLGQPLSGPLFPHVLIMSTKQVLQNVASSHHLPGPVTS